MILFVFENDLNLLLKMILFAFESDLYLLLKMILFDVAPSLQNTPTSEVLQLILTSLWFSAR